MIHWKTVLFSERRLLPLFAIVVLYKYIAMETDEIPTLRPEDGFLARVSIWLAKVYDRYRRRIWTSLAVLAIIGVHVYLGFAIAHNIHTAIAPIVIFALIYLVTLYFCCVKPWLKRISPSLRPYTHKLKVIWNYEIVKVPILKSGLVLGILGGFFAWIVIDSAGQRIRLMSAAGLVMYIILSVLVSANPGRIKWRPVIGGILLQFCVGVLVLRWPQGNTAFQWVSKQVVTFLDYTTKGTVFTYGFVSEPPSQICGFGTVFVYTALQIIIYFGAIVSVLYYLGVIEAVLSRVAWVMQYTVGTTAAESLNAAACIFLGQTEAAILIEPALVTMTDSEIHAVMTAGFACIAGSLFSAYISFGACPQYLLSATVMSAAVSLAVSKIVYPEVQASKQKSMKSFKFNARGHNNVLECISDGAVHSAQFVGAIAANLIVYIALLAFVNSVLSYFGSLVNYPELTFNQILAYIFFPLAYMMGASDAADPAVAMDETMKVAELMGMKTALNEFIAYQKLSEWKADGVLKGARAQTIATSESCRQCARKGNLFLRK
ncbi:hypothetical protein QR680_000135 [Steinernema hermaphroditum]|uniref:Sodium/nucleoside cotransporter n=1 Tax=Steinernema hermaphroditum TaxID=289476 RepID=A0AA39LDH3_9BILA|nr:hypothetical protein QR680_000135 [Steinernema hermaphroditum]